MIVLVCVGMDTCVQTTYVQFVRVQVRVCTPICTLICVCVCVCAPVHRSTTVLLRAFILLTLMVTFVISVLFLSLDHST